ncbi:sigma-54-dependent transcriptional regulator [Flavobacterium ponti]|uniref:Sigma-54-dependent transcriptional regulator n=1 Tax=Flavobacterium ponti TaxID=665133 RepID=A0ABV9P4N4_9FLAO
MPRILIIEDDTTFNNMLFHFLQRNEYEAEQAFSSNEGLQKLAEKSFDIILSDLRLPDMDGISLLSSLNEKGNTTPFVLMTAYADVKTAVKAIKKGAADYISKPFVPEEALLILKKILSSEKKVVVEKKTQAPKNKAQNSPYYWGKSTGSIQLRKHIDLVAPTPLSILITGENGTGKEVVAKTIHENSNRNNGPFVAVDCGAIPKDIGTSEFFGHVKGSFTGAINDKAGCFEAANTGTLFLDEIGNLSYENQILLLRAIQERKIKRIGSNKEIEIDIRILTATNENLKSAVEEGRFREDLFHRINEFSIAIPALRDRQEDIEKFAYLFLEKASYQLNKEVSTISKDAMLALLKYNWPGNIRELQNIIKRATLLSEGDTLTLLSLPEEIRKSENNDEIVGLKNKSEKSAIQDALHLANGNKSRAAEILGMARKTLYNKINQYNLD